MANMDRPTLLDVARELDPKGRPAMVVEVLHQMLPALQDAPAYPSNAPMGHKVTRRSALPSVGWTRINQGTTRSKGAVDSRVDTIGILSGLSEVDDKLRHGVSAEAFANKRWNEDQGFLEAYAQEVAKTLWYGDELTNDASFTGLAPRMPTKGAVAKTGSQCREYKAVVGGQTDVTSMYIVDWGERGAHLIYPENSQAGLIVDNLGKIRVTDADGLPFMAWVTQYDWLVGLAVEDERHIARLCNIDVSVANADTGFELGNGLIDILTAMPSSEGFNRVIYVSSEIEAAFWKQAIAKTNGQLSIRDYLGKPTAHFQQYPIRRDDQISVLESILS